MNSKKHAEVWEEVSYKLNTVAERWSGPREMQLRSLALFAEVVAESYRESDNAR